MKGFRIHGLSPAGGSAGQTPTISSDGTRVQWGTPSADASTGLPVIDVVADHGAAVDGVTDDTAAWQAAINAASAIGGARIISSIQGTSIIAGALQDTGSGGANAQLLLPAVHYGNGEGISIFIEGAMPPSEIVSVVGATPVPDAQLVLKSTLNAGAGGAVIGGRGPSGSPAGFTSVTLTMENLTVRLPSNPVLTGLNLSKVACADLDRVVVDTGSYDVKTLPQPTTATSYGIKLPGRYNGAHVRLGKVDVVGFYNGLESSEHTSGEYVSVWGCLNGVTFAAADHASKFQRLCAHHCQKVVRFTGTHYVDLDQLNIEHTDLTDWKATTADIDDPSNYGHGTVNWHVVKANVGIDATFTVNGGAGLQVQRIGTAAGAAPINKGRDLLTAAGGESILTLGAPPVPNSPLIWVNGAIAWPDVDYTIADDTVTFDATLTAGDIVAVIYDTADTPTASTLAAYVPSIVVADNFNRANSTTSIGVTSTGGVPWSAWRGAWGISSNAAYTSSASGTNYAMVESGVSDCTVKVTLANVQTQCGLAVRAVDLNNCYVVEGGSSAVNLYRVTAGSASVIGTAAAGTKFVSGDVVEIELAGSSITVKRNGATIITVTDAAHAGTKHGLYSVSTSTNRFDDFSVAA